MTSRNFDGLMMLVLSITIIISTFLISYLLTIFYILFIAINSSSNRIITNHIIILGKKLFNDLPSKEYKQRLDRAIVISKQQHGIKIYILGGITDKSTISESLAGKYYLIDKNITANNIYIEEKSQDTLDNLKQLKNNLLTTHDHITILTNRYHLARASVMAKSFGFHVSRCPAEDFFIINMKTIFKILIESFFLHWYLCGSFYATITRNKRMLQRIQ